MDCKLGGPPVIAWPTEKTLGRETISPDNVAAKALDGGPLRLVLMYHDGKPVNRNPQALMAKLMRDGAAKAGGECAGGKRTSEVRC